MIDYIGLFLTIGFWVIFAYALYAIDEPRFPLICAAIWLLAFGAPYVLPSAYVVCLVIRYTLPVVLTVWLKIRDAL